ncbi:MAG: aminotransferase class I/II-fold pyridoxal phosphate-dependent enzyme [Lewinellaceae bacterium]|nr:aminotransferase class I/II-fold pyridoxal phosphate-dependent enzyme [Lewinellaceae bacterium]
MIASAKRPEAVQEFYFAAKLREIAERRAAGKPVLNLGIGSPDQPPAPDVLQTLQTQAWQSDTHGYQPYTGVPELRKAWSDWYRRHYNVSLDPSSEILPLMGSKEGILHLAMAFLEHGDQALVPNPGYPSYRAATVLAGAEALPYALLATNGWQPDLAALAAQDLSRVKIMWVNYPHMPSGAPASKELFQRLLDFGRQHRILIVNDNPYSFILYEQPFSILEGDGAMDVAVELNSLSKSHNMAGWRMGVLTGKQTYLQTVLRFKSNLDSGQFRPLQMAAIKALTADDHWYKALNARYRLRQQVAFNILDRLQCQFDRQQQGMFVWAKIPEPWQDGFALSDHLLEQYDLFLTPGGIFGSNGDPYLRISLCSDVPVLEEALHRLSSYTPPQA